MTVGGMNLDGKLTLGGTHTIYTVLCTHLTSGQCRGTKREQAPTS